MIVRDERPGDWAAIRRVVAAAFGRPDEADLVDALRAAGDSVISLVAAAADTGAIVGHVQFSRMETPFRALGLGPISALQEWRRAGVGSRLVQDGLDRAAALGWEAVFVLGDPGFYRRFGFDAALARGFTSPYAGPYLLALALGDDLPVTEGRIDYAPAFKRFE